MNYISNNFELILEENKLCIERWKRDLKYHLSNKIIIDGILIMHSAILINAIFLVDIVESAAGNFKKKYNNDDILDIVKTMSLKEILTPINRDYIIDKFFVKCSIS